MTVKSTKTMDCRVKQNTPKVGGRSQKEIENI